MMLPNQIKNYSFSVAKQGMYRAAEVEEFKNKVYTAYSDLVKSNASLKEKFASLSDLVSEYNEGKNSIATTLIKSQSYADEIVEEAKKKAEEFSAQKKQEADKYYDEKIALANELHEKAETELERVMKQVSAKAEEYIEKINAQANDIIASANAQASTIVSRAYGDAKKARETCDDIVAQANKTLPEIKTEVVSFKTQTQKLLNIITQAIDSLDVPDVIEVEFESDKETEKQTVQAQSAEEFVYDLSAASSDVEAEIEIAPIEEEPNQIQEDQENEAETFEKENSVSDEASAASDYIFQRFSTFTDLFSSSEDEQNSDEEFDVLSSFDEVSDNSQPKED